MGDRGFFTFLDDRADVELGEVTVRGKSPGHTQFIWQMAGRYTAFSMAVRS